MEPIELEGKFYRPVTELYVWPAGLAILLWLALFLVRYGRELVADSRRNAKEDDTHVG